MVKKLVNTPQTFGQVINSTPMGGQGAPAVTRNIPGATDIVKNHGTTKVMPFVDNSMESYRKACANRDEPFAWTGQPKR